MDQNLGYAAGNNAGIAAAKGDYIVLLNNDTVVTPQWLDRMITCAEQEPEIGLVGPVTNQISGPQRVDGVPYDTTSLANLDEFAAMWAKEYNGKTHRFWRVVGFCMLIKRQVIDQIGGLDPRYGIGNFEDDDYCIRAAIAGFKSALALDSFIHHFGSRTFEGQRINQSSILYANWDIFKQKWGLAPDLGYGATWDLQSLLSRTYSRNEHYLPYIPETDARFRNIVEPELQTSCINSDTRLVAA
jgi:GT2 family glycosyltransferase